VKFQQRSTFGWGSSGAGYANPTRGLVIHYDGSNQGLAGKSHSSCVSYWKSTRNFHVGPSRGWADIGYSFGACPHGYVLEGRGLNRVQAAQPGGNDTWYSVTLMGGPGEDPTPAQITAVRQLRAWLMGKGVAGAVRGHRDFIPTSCPGDRLYKLVKDGTFSKPASAAVEEDDMQVTDPVPVGETYASQYNHKQYPASYLWVMGAAEAKRARIAAEANGAAVAELSRTVAALAADRGQEVDADALIERIEAAIERVSVRLDVEDEEAAGS